MPASGLIQSGESQARKTGGRAGEVGVRVKGEGEWREEEEEEGGPRGVVPSQTLKKALQPSCPGHL